MPRLLPLLLLLLLALSSCGQDLRFTISYDDIGGLAVGDPIVLDNQPIGKVTALRESNDGGHWVEVAIPRESAGAATSEASFILAFDPDNPKRRRIEVVLAGPGGKPIADGAVVKGTSPRPPGFFPFGELLRGFGDALRELRGQVERFRQEFQYLPDSPEAKHLQEEWRRLAEEIAKAQNEADTTLKKEILPKLEQEMEELRKRLEEIQKNPPSKGKPLET